MSSATIPLPTRRRSRLLGGPPGPLTFSVLTGEHQGRQIQLRGAKCTIGSARGCTLRLRARGVQPLHCWILRGAGGTIVRRRHRDTALNGHTFDDAPLSPGDRLRIGSIELEVNECPLPAADWTRATAIPLPIYDESDRALWERAAEESAAAIDRLRNEMQDLERRATSQLAELNELVGRVSSERDVLLEEVRDVQGQASDREALLIQKQQLEAALLTEKQQLEAALAAEQAELAELRSQIGSREAEIEAVLHAESRRVAEIQAKLEEVLRERSVLEATLQDQTDSLRDQCAARQHERDHLQQECQRLDVQLAQLRELVGYTAAERDHLTLHMDDAQQQLLAQQEQLREEKLDLVRRLEATHAQLAAAQRQLAVVQVEGDNHLSSEMERVSNLQQRLDQAEFDKSELETQLRQEAAAWQAERQQLCNQHQQLDAATQQSEGQLTHIRALVESLAAERESLCQQLEAADFRLAAEQEQQAAQQAALQQQVADLARQLAQRDEQQGVATGERTAQLEAQVSAGHEQLAALQVQLADAETRLAAAQAQAQSHIESEHEQRAEWERRAGELQYQLTAAQLQVAAVEDELARARAEQGEAQGRVAGMESDFAARLADCEARLQAQAEQAQQWEQQVGQAQTDRAAMESQLAEQADAVRFERDTWHHDRERLHQECRMLGHRLIQKQKDLDEVQASVRAAAQPVAEHEGQAAPMTITMDQIQRQMETAAALEEERAVWDAQRDQLQRQIDELQVQLGSRPEFTQQMTLNQDAVAQLQSGIDSDADPSAEAERIVALELQIEDLQRELEAGRNQQPAEPQQLASDGESQALADERARLREEAELLAAAQQEAAAQQAETQAAQAEFESRWRQWEENLRGKEELLNRQAEELGTRLDAATARMAQLDTEAGAQAEREAELRQAHAIIVERQGELERREIEIKQATAQIAAALNADSSEEATAEPTLATHDSHGVEAALGRLVESGVWHGDAPQAAEETAQETAEEAAPAGEYEAPAVEAASVPEHCAAQFAASSSPAGEAPKPVWNQPDAVAPPADDDSIEAYMSRLLRRVRGDAPDAAPTFVPARLPDPMPQPQAADEENVSMTVEVHIEPVKPEDYLPRQKAPELTTDLAAMRELANSAARTAIVKHQKRSGHQQAMVKSVGAGMTLTCSLGAAYFAYVNHSVPAAAGAAIGLAAAAYWGGKAALHAVRTTLLKPQGSGASKLPAPAAQDEEPQHEPAQEEPLEPIASLDPPPLELPPPEENPSGGTLSAD